MHADLPRASVEHLEVPPLLEIAEEAGPAILQLSIISLQGAARSLRQEPHANGPGRCAGTSGPPRMPAQEWVPRSSLIRLRQLQGAA